jgi:hypothetical protein
MAFRLCGPKETRTLDLYSAIVALSQLSYRPQVVAFYSSQVVVSR